MRPDVPPPKRSVKHVRAAAKLLAREARKILAKHSSKLAASVREEMAALLARIEAHFAAENWGGLETDAERLDELLHEHAAFARKSPLRETIENVLVAVLIALGLRSCLYEPFKIPSGSMMPTLRAGDHIFVNKFVYGIQIPFTNRVVGESLGEIEHGDVMVFRYPLDESEDFIKRVMGLPGDELRVDGEHIEIKRAGEAEFRTLQHTRLDEPCYDDSGQRVVPDCQLYLEDNGDKSYVVRYLDGFGDLQRAQRVWKVPEGHLLVMGDNRRQSHDSLAWTVTVEAVSADGLLSVKDLRDLTAERMFGEEQQPASSWLADPNHDHVSFIADHRAPEHDLQLEVWRRPAVGLAAVMRTLTHAGLTRVQLADLIRNEDNGRVDAVTSQRLLQAGQGIDELYIQRETGGTKVVVALHGSEAALRLACGAAVCKDGVSVAQLVVGVVERLARDVEQDARELIDPPQDVRYSRDWSGRGLQGDRFVQRRFAPVEGAGVASKDDAPSGPHWLAWRNPENGSGFMRELASQWLGVDEESVEWKAASDGGTVGVIRQPDRLGAVIQDAASAITFALACPRCTDAQLRPWIGTVQQRMLEVGSDRSRFANLLVEDDLPGYVEVPIPTGQDDGYDRVEWQATARDVRYGLDLEVWRKPEEGTAAKLDALRSEGNLKPIEGRGDGWLGASDATAHAIAFVVPASDLVVKLHCRTGLCTTMDMALALSDRVAEKALDPSNFVDPHAEQPRPFVPRGNVKGRAERIWLPWSRFWLPIR